MGFYNALKILMQAILLQSLVQVVFTGKLLNY